MFVAVEHDAVSSHLSKVYSGATDGHVYVYRPGTQRTWRRRPIFWG